MIAAGHRPPQYRRAVTQRWLDADQQRTWRSWLSVSELLPRALDAQLQRDAGISHAAYVVLAMLSEAPGRSRGYERKSTRVPSQ